MSASLSTHALDSALGRPAAGLEVTLVDSDGHELEESATGTDGRVRFATALEPGSFALRFATGPWFSAADRAAFYPVVEIAFLVEPDEPHYHVALLLGPWSYTTYRGS